MWKVEQYEHCGLVSRKVTAVTFEIKDENGALYGTCGTRENAEIVVFGLNNGFQETALGGFSEATVEKIKQMMKQLPPMSASLVAMSTIGGGALFDIDEVARFGLPKYRASAAFDSLPVSMHSFMLCEVDGELVALTHKEAAERGLRDVEFPQPEEERVC